MEQFHVGQEKVKASLVFDGAVDGVVLFRQTGPGDFTQDPAVYDPGDPGAPGDPGDPDNGIPATDPIPARPASTTVVVHHSNPPGGETGMVSVAVIAKADQPGTPVKEEINGSYEFEWIPAGAAKAAHINVSLESEPA